MCNVVACMFGFKVQRLKANAFKKREDFYLFLSVSALY